MELKELAAIEKPQEKESEAYLGDIPLEEYKEYLQEKLELSKYQVPEDSKCIKDLDKIAEKVRELIDHHIYLCTDVINPLPADEKYKCIGICHEAIKMLDLYRHARLDVEFARRMKFNLYPGDKS